MPNEFPKTTPESSTTVAVANAAGALQFTLMEMNQTLTLIYSELSKLRQTVQELTKQLSPPRQ
jgi:hypothetical protein